MLGDVSSPPHCPQYCYPYQFRFHGEPFGSPRLRFQPQLDRRCRPHRNLPTPAQPLRPR